VRPPPIFLEDLVRRLACGIALLVATTLLAPAHPGLAAPANAAPAAAERASVPDELLVGYGRGTSGAQRAEARSKAGAHLVERVVEERADRGAVELVRFAGNDRSEAMRRFTSNPNVTFAEPNWLYTHDATSDDPYFTDGSLWGMAGDQSSPANAYGSQAAEAWAAGQTGSDTVYVGIIDEGYQYNHPDLAANAGNPGETAGNGVDDDHNGYVDDVYGWDFDGNNNSVYDGTQDDHGTHVAGTIGARGGNGVGVAGVVWNVKLLSAKFLGRRGGTTANAVKAVDYFTDLKTLGVNLVATNNSWGGGGYSQALFDAIARAGDAGILFVAAAGNDGNNIDASPSYPASYTSTNLISVAAIDKTGARASWSNYGAARVDLGAPGVGIYSTLPDGTYGSYSGTSMATPHVTGAVALYAAAHPAAGAAAIRTALLNAAVLTSSLSGATVTGGRLDVVRALAGDVSPSPDPGPDPDPAVLTVTVTAGAKKKNGVTPVTVAWTGFGGSSVDVYRAGTKISTQNDGTLTEKWRGPGTATYEVCETGSTTACAEGSTVI
jgi:subtilisin family serine protease